MGEAITDCLLLLYHSGNDAELAAVYHAWGARSRGVSERWTMQQAIESACARQGIPSFEVTPTQVMAFKVFWFFRVDLL
jgi:hypothetical protein